MINTHAQARTAFSELKELEHEFWFAKLSERQLLDIVDRKNEIVNELDQFVETSKIRVVVDNTQGDTNVART